MQIKVIHFILLGVLICPLPTPAQDYGEPDRGKPGDRMIQEYLSRVTLEIHDHFLKNVRTLDDWKDLNKRYKQEYLYMLGLSPLPEKTPLNATTTGRIPGDGYEVDLLHFQSSPQLYVTANLYRPDKRVAGQRLPAVLYVCGHSKQGRDGNKTAYQSHGIWFARHGYVCLIIDTLQLGEIAGTHLGTYSKDRWWWHSRGYTPAGVECWNGIRAIDYLASRDDVDPERIGVTGISGGGAATFWIAAADPRASVAIPLSGMADLPSYVNSRTINGHCDCMFLYNVYQWPWTRIAAQIAPRPLLFCNSDADSIFPMDANERIISRLERVYSLYGAGDDVDAVVSKGGHAYRKDLRQSAFRYLNSHLKYNPRPVDDSEIDLVTEPPDSEYPIAPEELRVFPTDEDLPADQRNTIIDEHFVPIAQYELPTNKPEFDSWRDRLMQKLRSVVFRCLPQQVPAAKLVREDSSKTLWLETEQGIEIPLNCFPEFMPTDQPKRLLLLVKGADSAEGISEYVSKHYRPGDLLVQLEPRGIGPTAWTRFNPPNYVERAHAILGRTVDTGRVRDVIAAARYLKHRYGDKPLLVLGEQGASVLALYAALWEEEVNSVAIANPPATHMNSEAPQFLNVLRVCDIPEVVGMLSPREVELTNAPEVLCEKAATLFRASGNSDQLEVL